MIHEKHSMNSGYSSKKKTGFVFYITGYSFPHNIKSQSCVVIIFILAFNWSLINGGTTEVLFMLKGIYVSKKTTERKIHP